LPENVPRSQLDRCAGFEVVTRQPIVRSPQNIMKILRNCLVVLALTGVAMSTVACPEKGPVEKAGKKVDDAIDKTKDAVK
jgi:hypothetical protein